MIRSTIKATNPRQQDEPFDDDDRSDGRRRGTHSVVRSLTWSKVYLELHQRRRLPLIGDIISRYVINLGHTMSNTCYVSSIKSKAGGVRYVDMGEASCVCFVCSSIPTCVGNRLSSAQQYLARGCVRFK
jgi:hypothetical protein